MADVPIDPAIEISAALMGRVRSIEIRTRRLAACTRAARDPDTGRIESVPASQSYYAWLKTQPAAFQDAVIGPTRGALIRRAGLSAQRFAELQLGKNFKPLDLESMRELEPVAFERAGI